jgi:hypothetical protein
MTKSTKSTKSTTSAKSTKSTKSQVNSISKAATATFRELARMSATREAAALDQSRNNRDVITSLSVVLLQLFGPYLAGRLHCEAEQFFITPDEHVELDLRSPWPNDTLRVSADDGDFKIEDFKLGRVPIGALPETAWELLVRDTPTNIAKRITAIIYDRRFWHNQKIEKNRS